jgi:hypothetical protein
MRTTLTAILILFAIAFVRCAVAAGAYPVTDADKKFLAEIVGALQKKDTAWLASHMSYPLSVVVSNRTHIVKSQEEFSSILSLELTDSIRTKIIELAKQPLFKNWQGVMVGDGLLWFTEYQRAGDKTSTYGIFAIGNFAFQPKDFFPPKEGANKSLQATRDGRSSSASRFTSFGPACLSSGR